MEKIIYILVDCDGDAICSFEDQEEAIKEAKECGCDVEELRYITKL